MENARGAIGAGAYPPLASDAKTVSKYYILAVRLIDYHGMPRSGDQMDDGQIVEVSTSVRTRFCNDFRGAIPAEDVSGLRMGGAD